MISLKTILTFELMDVRNELMEMAYSSVEAYEYRFEFRDAAKDIEALLSTGLAFIDFIC